MKTILFTNTLLLYFLTSVLLLSTSFTKAQVWEKQYGGISDDWGYCIKETSDSGYILAGTTKSYGNGDNDVYMIKTNFAGDTLWTKTFGGVNGDEAFSVVESFDGSYVTTGRYDFDSATGGSKTFLLKTDNNGNLLWSKTYGGTNSTGFALQQTNDSGFIITGYDISNTFPFLSCNLIKTNSSGDTTWTKVFNLGAQFGIGTSVQQTNDGGYIICGSLLSPNNIFLLKTDLIGNLLWSKTYFGVNNEYVFCKLLQLSDGGFVIAGSTTSFGNGLSDVYVIRTNDIGDTLWTRTFGGTNDDKGYDIIQTPDDGFVILGETRSFVSDSSDIFLIRIDNNGNLLGTAIYGAPSINEVGISFLQTNDNNYVVLGGIQDSDYNVFLIKIPAIGTNLTNNISGNVFQDFSSDCIYDSSEVPLSYKLLKITPGPKYATTNSQGFYSLLSDTGTFNVESLYSSIFWQQTCPTPPTYTVNFTSFYDTSSSNNFGYEIAIYCPLLTVDISTWAIRPCMQSTYTVHYCNNGTIPADSAYIEVTFDNEITPVSSTLPWSSQNGNTFTFSIGNVAVNQCGTFFITADVSCNAVMGSTHCIEAHIYPDSICTPVDTSWDHSSVSVEGICFNDSLACFTIFNSGDDMLGASQWRIYENNTLVDTGTFQLFAGDSMVICHPAEGLTIRLEADQRPGHPGNSQPQANIELCNGIPPAASTGFITQVPEDDADEFIEMDCREITGSFDPNEKLVKPAGITQNHFIDSTDILEYQVNFQNTGTDTAFKIVVRDTLTQSLDITSVQSGASSHPYSFRIYGQGILEWTFSNILLPDSNTNEALSHGFVRFKTKQKTGNTIGTVIENRAAIYFDYNAPVITNTTFNTVWKEGALSVPKIYEENTGILVYPNPGSGRYSVISNRHAVNKLEVYNILGEEIYGLPNTEYRLQFSIDLTNQPAGIYIYKVFSGERMIGAGKLVVE